MKFHREHNFFKDRKVLFSLGVIFLILVIYFNIGVHNHSKLADTTPLDFSQNQDPLAANHQIDTTPIPQLYPGLPWEPVDLGKVPAFVIAGKNDTEMLRGTSFAVKVGNFKATASKVFSYYEKTLPPQDWHSQLTVNSAQIIGQVNHDPNGDQTVLGYVKYAGGKLYAFILTADYNDSKLIVYYSDALKVTNNFPN